MAVNASNSGDKDAEETIAVSIGEDSNLQFARKIWIPAGGRRRAWLPVEIPSELTSDQVNVPSTSMRLKTSGGGEQLQTNYVGEETTQRSLLLDHSPSVTGAITDPRTEEEILARKSLVETDLIYAGRKHALTEEQSSLLPESTLDLFPPRPEALDAVDQMVVASDRMWVDSRAIEFLSQWLRRGGRLWIMLDKVDHDAVNALLGDESCFSVVDTVELNDFHIQLVDALTKKSIGEGDAWSSEHPATFVRVMAETDDVTCKINGWPAAFWKQVGEGEVMFTTLSADGWFHKGNTVAPFRPLAIRFFSNRNETIDHLSVIAPMTDNQIGYQIPKRSQIVSVLTVHAVLLMIAGLILAKLAKLEWLAVVVPVAAIVAAASLFGIGRSKTQAIPPTVATGQIAQISSDGSKANIHSVASIYRPDQQPLPIVSSPDTKSSLTIDASDAEIKRIVYDDSGRENWQFVTQRPGVVQHVSSTSTVHFNQPWRVTGTFDDRGFVAKTDQGQTIEDAMVLAPARPTLALHPAENSANELSGNIESILPPGRFIQDRMLTDTQRQRQQFLQALFSSEGQQFGDRLSLLGWTNPLNGGVRFGDDYSQVGWTLASIPIQWQRPKAGSKFMIPATFIKPDTVTTGEGVSAIFDPRTGEWIEELTQAKQAKLRFVVPDEVFPCNITKAIGAIRLSAPSRTLTIQAQSGDSTSVVFEKQDPVGVYSFEIDDPSLLSLDEKGALQLTIDVSASKDDIESKKTTVITEIETGPTPTIPDVVTSNPNRNTWSIESIHVSMHAEMKP